MYHVQHLTALSTRPVGEYATGRDTQGAEAELPLRVLADGEGKYLLSALDAASGTGFPDAVFEASAASASRS